MKKDISIDWGSLPFGYFPTDYNVRCLYRDGEWGEIRFDFATGTAEIVWLAEWDTIKSNIFARTATRHIQSLPEAKPPSEVVVMFDQAM